MPKVVARPAETTPPAPALAAEPNTFTDGRGRRIKIRKLDVVQQFRLIRLIGGENSSFYSICAKLAKVDAIDGDYFPIPDRLPLFERVARRLGEDGLLALTIHLVPADADEDPAPPAPRGDAPAPASQEPAAPAR